jgi:hypothetical protein
MSIPWIAPGANGPAEDPAQGPADGGWGQPGPAGAGGPAGPGAPRRELVQSTPLFPLRPLGLGEILAAAVRIYRLRARSVLGVAAAVFGVAFVVITLSTGAGMIPMIGDMQAMMEDPAASADAPFFSSVGDGVLFVLTSVLTGLVTMLASSLVTVALTRVALGEAIGAPVPTAEMWATMRRRGLPALGVGLLVALLSVLLFALPFALGLLPLLIVQEAGWLTILPLVLGTLAGLLLMLWLWARTLLAVPALVLEDTSVLGAVRRSFVLTRGRRMWRVLGIALLLYLLYTVATQVISGVTGTIAGIAYFAILLVSSFEAIVLGVAVLTILSMLGAYIASFLLAPFLSAGYTALYADVRMRDEAWDVELTRRAREAWAADGAR